MKRVSDQIWLKIFLAFSSHLKIFKNIKIKITKYLFSYIFINHLHYCVVAFWNYAILNTERNGTVDIKPRRNLTNWIYKQQQPLSDLGDGKKLESLLQVLGLNMPQTISWAWEKEQKGNDTFPASFPLTLSPPFCLLSALCYLKPTKNTTCQSWLFS